MRILWLHQYFATPKGWGAVRTYEFARRFVKAGHAVDVVCCAGYDASLKPTGGDPLVIDGVRVFVSGTAYRPHMGFLRRIVSFLSFMGYALWFVARRGGAYDAVIASSGPLTLAVPALAGRWMRGLPFVFEVIDVWPDSAIAAGVLKISALKWLSFRLEALAYRYASAIVTCSTGMTERVKGKLEVRSEELGVGQEGSRGGTGKASRPGAKTRSAIEPAAQPHRGRSNVTTISNCCDLDEFVPDEDRRKRIRAQYGVADDQTIALYTGAMGLSNAVDDLRDAIRETAADGRIVWWVAGNGPRGDEIRAALAESGRNRFFGSLPKAELIDLYLAADVNVVTFMHAPLFYENSPNKFFDGIAAGLPAVFNRTTWLAPWLEAYGCGLVCTSEDAGAEMARQLALLAGDRARRRAMAAGARRLAEEVFDRDKLAAKYLAVLEEVLKCESSGALN